MNLIRARMGIVIVMMSIVATVAGGIFETEHHWLVLPVAVVGSTAAGLPNRSIWVRMSGYAVAIVVATIAVTFIIGGSLGDLFPDLINGPRALLTTEWPSPADPTVVATVATFVGVITALAVDLAAQPSRHLSALAALAVGFVAFTALRAPNAPDWSVLVMLGIAALIFASLRPGSQVSLGRATRRPDRSTIVSIIAIALVSFGVTSVVAWADRADPRHVEAADRSEGLVRSLESIAALRTAEPAVPLFEISDRSALIARSMPSHWRIAALDTYDGQRWLPRTALRPMGGRLGTHAQTDPDLGAPLAFTLTFLSDGISLLPFPGRPLAVNSDVETDLDRVVVRLPKPGSVGQTLDLVADPPLTVAVATNAGISPRPISDLAGRFTQLANTIAGDGTSFERLQRVEATMRSEWQLDPFAPGGGQQLALIERFAIDTRRGTTEQFTTTFVLLARSMGLDARIAVGYVVPTSDLRNPMVIASDHAAIWPEVHVSDIGWVAFNPTPDIVTGDETEPAPPPEAQTPAAAQPPIAPPTEQRGDDGEETTVPEPSSDRWNRLTTWVTRGATATGLALLPLALALGGILLFKWLRRRRRLRAGSARSVVRGAWANATDSLVDAGLTIRPSWTNDHIAQAGGRLASAAPQEVRRLAAMSTEAIFGPTDAIAAMTSDARAAATHVDQAIAAQLSVRQRIRWRLSLRSLRRTTRSPVH